MISLLIASVVGLTAMQAGIDGPRKAYVACLKSAFEAASNEKVAAPDYGGYLAKACAPQADSLRSGLVGFDVRNGIRRTQASADAQAQIDDYVAMSRERYVARWAANEPKAPVSAPASTAAATPASTVAVAPKN